MRRSLSLLVSASLAVTGMTAGFVPSALAIPAMPEASQSGGIVLVKSGGDQYKKKKKGGGKHAKSSHSKSQHASRHHEQRHTSSHSSRHHDQHYADRHRSHHDTVVVRNTYHNSYYDHHRHYDDHYNGGAAVAAGIAGFAAGTIVGSTGSIYSRPPVYYGGYGGSSWAATCAARYRSFNPTTGMYRGYDGYWHRCAL
jgi:hypothetical protein